MTKTQLTNGEMLKANCFDTPLGQMIAVANDKELYVLEFIDRRGLEAEVKRLQKKTNSKILLGIAPPIESIQSELINYFAGKLKQFKTPLQLIGTSFQKCVWQELQKIPYGQTRSYLEIAQAINKPTAFRAVALANGANPLSIIIPCHRVINHNGLLGGYGGGIQRKEWLLSQEAKMVCKVSVPSICKSFVGNSPNMWPMERRTSLRKN